VWFTFELFSLQHRQLTAIGFCTVEKEDALNAGEFVALSATVGERVFAIDTQTLFDIALQTINVTALFILLTLLLYKPVQSFLQARTERVADQLRRTEDNLAAAEETRAKLEARLAEIEQERVEMLETARTLGVEKRGEIIRLAQVDAEEERERARIEIQREQDRIRGELEQFVIATASQLAERILEHSIDQETHKMLFDQTIAELEEAKWLN